MNDATNPDLVDFVMAMVRKFEVREGRLVFGEDSRDMLLRQRATPHEAKIGVPAGLPLTPAVMDEYLSKGRGEFLRFRGGL